MQYLQDIEIAYDTMQRKNSNKKNKIAAKQLLYLRWTPRDSEIFYNERDGIEYVMASEILC